ncbi:sororin isoform X1 [Dromiciops gliroides]|uniref:sororin isoform X1 n=1 Tax=Dromiciops gliroides TaxID=33562 RepID=UPI001CC7A9FB|nr:sororin isoform X1 [Dromiciops gliroides]
MLFRRHFRLGGVFERPAPSAADSGFVSAREQLEMSARRSRSRSRSGAAGERGGSEARPSDPASPPPPAPGLRRSQRKSGSAPEGPPQIQSRLPPPAAPSTLTDQPLTPSAVQPSTPAPRKTIALRKIVPPTTEVSSPAVQKRAGPQTPEAAPPGARKPLTGKKLVARTNETPSSQGRKSEAKKKVSPYTKITLLEKENAPPLQESALPREDGSLFSPGPALEMTTTVLGPLSPSAGTRPSLMDARDLEMSKKVRRSYSRLDDLGSGSTSTPNYRRRSFFGFERLLLGEELENVSPVGKKELKSQAVAPIAEPWGPDSTLPGITMTKEKRRKRKVPEILKSELDEWAAAMNAQFEAAEKFDLLVE